MNAIGVALPLAAAGKVLIMSGTGSSAHTNCLAPVLPRASVAGMNEKQGTMIESKTVVRAKNMNLWFKEWRQ